MKSNKPLIERILDNWPAKVLSLFIAIMLSWFNRVSQLEERFFSAPLKVEANAGYVPASPYPRMVRISLRGEPSALSPILEEDISVFIDLSKYRSEGVVKAPVQIKRKGSALNADPLEIRVEPAEIALALEQKLQRTVPVIPSFRGYLEPGFELSGFVLDPPSVEIEGPKSLIEKARDVTTDFIELTARKEDFMARVPLIPKDPLIKFSGLQAVEFRATVKKAIALKTLENLPIALLNLAPTLKIEGDSGMGAVKLQASDQDLRDFIPDPELLSIDLTEVKRPGIYVLSVLVKAPEGFLALSHEPESVTIRVIESKGTGP